MSARHEARGARALMVLFAISGFAGLIYESIWTQYLGLFLGHAAYAQSFVLVLFMGGMALGAWLVSRRSARITRPLAVYAVVELAIGMLGMAFNPLYHAATGFAYTHLFPLVGDGFGLDLTRYAVSTLLIGAQCVALGATFPLMSAGYLRTDSASGGRVLAGLYFSNSFGAALGALVATFVLLPNVGLPGTVMTGGLLSILVALCVWPLGKDASSAATTAPTDAGGSATQWLILAAAAITGATSFVYEITWIRMLALALGSTLHAFELMLAAFIAGIAFGGLWLRQRADRWIDAVAAAGWAQVLMGVAALGSLFVYAHSFDWVASLLHGLASSTTGYTFYNVATGAIAVAVMFPAAFFAGMTLPLLTLVLLRRGSGEQAIGRVYAANTLGAIIGVLLTMHVLMPMLGVRISLWLAALGDLSLGVVLLTRATTVNRPRIMTATAVALVTGLCAFVFTRVDPLALASSVYRVGEALLPKGTQMLFYGDGKTASVALYERSDEAQLRSIATNGKVDASIVKTADGKPAPDEYTMTLAAVLPLAFIDHPKNVAVIGFGSGMTVNTFLGSDRIERLDVIEIEPFMVEAAKGFGDRVARAYRDPRAHIVIDDAKAFLAGTSRKYDVIVAEPSNPWVNGVAALFSEEFYDFVPRHLVQDGLYVQWLQMYEISPQLVGSVLKAMLPHFADVKAYISNKGDMLLVASPHGVVPAPGDPAARDPRLEGELARLGIGGGTDLSMFSLMDKQGLAAVAALSSTPANSDFFPVLQLQAPEARFMRKTALELSELQKSPLPILEVIGGYRPPPASTELHPVVTYSPRDPVMRAAREYHDALLSGTGVHGRFATADVAYLSDALRAVPRTCADFDAGKWIEASAALAGATIPYLAADDLKGVWIEPAWLPECARTDPSVKGAMAFYAAVAARDWPQVAEIGPRILAKGDVGGDFGSYVLLGSELGSLATGSWKSVFDIENAFGTTIKGQPFARQLMLALADIGMHARPSVSR